MSGILSLCSLIMLSIYPGQVEFATETGTIVITIRDETSYISEQGALNSQVVIENINARLAYLEEICVRNLTRSDHLTASLLLAESRFLLALLPGNHFIVLTPHIPLPVTPVSAVQFDELAHGLEQEPFSENRLMIIRAAARSHFFTVDQVRELLDIFVFEDDRIEAVRLLYPCIVDADNAYRLYDKFYFSSSKEELATILQ